MPGTNTETHSDKDIEGNAAETSLICDSVGIPDPNIVDWKGPYDPENPKDWSSSKRWSHIVLVAALSLVTYV